jgi:hypothetical protein
MDFERAFKALDMAINSKGNLSNTIKAQLQEAKDFFKATINTKNHQNRQSIVTPGTSYSDVANPNFPSAIEPKIDPKCIIKVFPKRDESGFQQLKSSEATKQYVKEKVKKGNFAIKSVKTITGNGISILCRSKEEAKELHNQLTEECRELVSKQPQLRDPRFSFFLPGVDYDIVDIKEEIVKKNPTIRENDIELTNLTKTKNGNTIAYVNTKPDAYRVIKEYGFRLYVYFECVNLRKMPATSQCFNCGRFGHNSKKCLFTLNDNPAKQCLRCGENHTYLGCTNAPKCSNCNHKNANTKNDNLLKVDHSANDPNCPCFKRAMKQAELQINYV